MAGSPRLYHQQMVHFLRKAIAYTDNGSTLTVGVLPAGATVIKPMSGVHVVTAFNGSAVNAVDIGPSGSTSAWGSALSLATATFVAAGVASGSYYVATDTTVQCVVTSSATASAGTGQILIAYIPNTDG